MVIFHGYVSLPEGIIPLYMHRIPYTHSISDYKSIMFVLGYENLGIEKWVNL